MKKTLLAVALFSALSVNALAQQSISGLNSGSINNTVSTQASTSSPNSSSFSYATGNAGSTATATIQWGGIPTGNTAGLTAYIAGSTSTYNNGAAGNVITGIAVGSASTIGNAIASADATYNGNFNGLGSTGGYSTTGTLMLDGNSNGTGTNIAITAGANTGASAGAAASGSFTGTGYVGSNISTVNNVSSIIMNGSVSDTKLSSSDVSTGTLTLNNVVLSNATQTVNAVNVVNVTGSFEDPVQ